MEQVHHIVDLVLATTMHATCYSMHHILGMMPGDFVYQRDMFLNIPLSIAKFQTIQFVDGEQMFCCQCTCFSLSGNLKQRKEM
jgi:hypothetical protein